MEKGEISASNWEEIFIGRGVTHWPNPGRAQSQFGFEHLEPSRGFGQHSRPVV